VAGYFTIADLFAIWQSSVDPLYAQPFIDAGDGGGLEAYNQAFAQYERVSQAIMRSTQALFILPHSAQLAEPAAGDSNARVTVLLAREAAYQFPIVFTSRVSVEEIAYDHGVDERVEVHTGRRYTMNTVVVFEPGEVGPKYQPCVAEVPGYSHNNPEPGSISTFVQVGAGQHNDRASVVSGDGEDVVYAANEYATFLPDMIGQYVRLSSAVNEGKVRRVTSYLPPSLTPVEHGGAVGLAQDVVMVVGLAAAYLASEKVVDSVTGATGTLLSYNSVTGAVVVQRAAGIFAVGGNLVGQTTLVATPIASVSTVGMLVALYLGLPLAMWWANEGLVQAGTGATGTFLYANGSWAIVIPTSGTFIAGNLVTGLVSAIAMTPTNVGVEPSLVDEGATCAWHVMEWGDDLGFTVTNPLSPLNGKLGFLDEIGRERKIPRADGESDASYRRRVAKIPDVVSPNAIRRACSRFFTPHGWVAEFREVGTLQFPGFFYDIPSNDAPTYAGAWDMDFTVRPQDRFRTWTDYAEFRAFFLIGVPATGLGEFGFAYDAHPLGFYDIGPLLDHYDGYPVGEGALNKALYNDIVARKAGGVGFDFYKQ